MGLRGAHASSAPLQLRPPRAAEKETPGQMVSPSPVPFITRPAVRTLLQTGPAPQPGAQGPADRRPRGNAHRPAASPERDRGLAPAQGQLRLPRSGTLFRGHACAEASAQCLPVWADVGAAAEEGSVLPGERFLFSGLDWTPRQGIARLRFTCTFC